MKYHTIKTVNGKEKFYEFENKEEFRQWQKEIFGAWAKQYNRNSAEYKEHGCGPFDKVMATCIEQYCGHLYGTINGYLRGEPGCDRMLNYIFALDECFKTVPCTNINLLCYRNMSIDEMKSYKINGIAKGYLSVSSIYENCKEIWDNGRVITILIPKGMPIICPSLITMYERNDKLSDIEAELIIPRNMIMQKKFCKYIVLNERKSSLCK